MARKEQDIWVLTLSLYSDNGKFKSKFDINLESDYILDSSSTNWLKKTLYDTIYVPTIITVDEYKSVGLIAKIGLGTKPSHDEIKAFKLALKEAILNQLASDKKEYMSRYSAKLEVLN